MPTTLRQTHAPANRGATRPPAAFYVGLTDPAADTAPANQAFRRNLAVPAPLALSAVRNADEVNAAPGWTRRGGGFAATFQTGPANHVKPAKAPKPAPVEAKPPVQVKPIKNTRPAVAWTIEQTPVQAFGQGQAAEIASPSPAPAPIAQIEPAQATTKWSRFRQSVTKLGFGKKSAASGKAAKTSSRRWKPWAAGFAGVVGALTALGTFFGASALFSSTAAAGAKGGGVAWKSGGGAPTVLRGAPVWDCGPGPFLGTAAVAAGAGLAVGTGLYGAAKSTAGMIHATRNHNALAARIRDAEGRLAAAKAGAVGKKAQQGDATEDVAAIESELNALLYAQDAQTRHGRDRAFRGVTAGLDIATGLTLFATGGFGLAAAACIAAPRLALTAGKLATDFGVQKGRNAKAAKFHYLKTRDEMQQKGEGCLSSRERFQLQKIQRTRTIRAKWRRGDKLSWREWWNLKTSVNEDAASWTKTDRATSTADYILESSGDERQFMLQAVGISQKKFDKLTAKTESAPIPRTALRDSLARSMRRL